ALVSPGPDQSSAHICTSSFPAFESGPPSSGDLLVERERLEAWAYIVLQKFSRAEQKLEDAERHCEASAPQACANVIRARGRLEMELGHFKSAQQFFDQTLVSAREREDHFLEATALLNLGWSALLQEHFDEALDWSDGAYRLSNGIDAGYIVQTALGNLGWAYYRLGDPEKAIALFLEARERAKRIGAI